MIKEYRFRFKNNSIVGKDLYINNHKVHSGIYTMLFYKISENERYIKEHSTTIKFEGMNGYFDTDVTHAFIRGDLKDGDIK